MRGDVHAVHEAVESVPSCNVQLEQPRGQATHQRSASTTGGELTEAITRFGLEESNRAGIA
jgi:hypothetical protein